MAKTYYTIRLTDYGYWTVFFSAIELSEYQIGKLKKLADYPILDQGLNLSDYRISDSEKISVNHP
jgi:hypothetical protein